MLSRQPLDGPTMDAEAPKRRVAASSARVLATDDDVASSSGSGSTGSGSITDDDGPYVVYPTSSGTVLDSQFNDGGFGDIGLQLRSACYF